MADLDRLLRDRLSSGGDLSEKIKSLKLFRRDASVAPAITDATEASAAGKLEALKSWIKARPLEIAGEGPSPDRIERALRRMPPAPDLPTLPLEIDDLPPIAAALPESEGDIAPEPPPPAAPTLPPREVEITTSAELQMLAELLRAQAGPEPEIEQASDHWLVKWPGLHLRLRPQLNEPTELPSAACSDIEEDPPMIALFEVQPGPSQDNTDQSPPAPPAFDIDPHWRAPDHDKAQDKAEASEEGSQL